MDLKKAIESELSISRQLMYHYRKTACLHEGETLSVMHRKLRRDELYSRIKGSRRKKYVSWNDLNYLEEMYEKYFAEQAVSILRKNIDVLEAVLEQYESLDTERIAEALPDTYRLLAKHLKSKNLITAGTSEDSQIVRQSENPNHTEELNYLTQCGLLVRSKSETFIADPLHALEFSFGYEQKLILKETAVDRFGNASEREIPIYPDFTIYLPGGEEIYWEHMGLCDKYEYRDQGYRKIDLYYENGIYLGKNLIITVEGKGKTFDRTMAMEIIRNQLLPKL